MSYTTELILQFGTILVVAILVTAFYIASTRWGADRSGYVLDKHWTEDLRRQADESGTSRKQQDEARAEVKRLRGVLQHMADHDLGTELPGGNFVNAARAALAMNMEDRAEALANARWSFDGGWKTKKKNGEFIDWKDVEGELKGLRAEVEQLRAALAVNTEGRHGKKG